MSLWPDLPWTPRRMTIVGILGVLFCFCSLEAETFRTVRGTVRDQNGKVLAGAVVELEDRTTLQIRSCLTKPDGTYYFGILFPDLSYHLRANFAGASSHTKVLSRFSSNEAKTIDFVINLRKTK